MLAAKYSLICMAWELGGPKHKLPVQVASEKLQMMWHERKHPYAAHEWLRQQ